MGGKILSIGLAWTARSIWGDLLLARWTGGDIPVFYLSGLKVPPEMISDDKYHDSLNANYALELQCHAKMRDVHKYHYSWMENMPPLLELQGHGKYHDT